MCEPVKGFPTDEKPNGVPVNKRLRWRVGSPCESTVPQACHVLPVGVVRGGIRVEHYKVVVMYG